MGSFSLAVAGNLQTAAQQIQLANGLNGTTAVSASPYGGATTVPATALFTAGVSGTPTFLKGLLSGGTDTFGRIQLRHASNGYGEFAAGAGTSKTANWYGSSSGWATDFAVSVSGSFGVDNLFTAPSASVTGGFAVTGALTASGTVQADAPNFANGAVANTPTAGAQFALSDDGTNLLWNTNAPAGVSRGFEFVSVDAGGTGHRAGYANGSSFLWYTGTPCVFSGSGTNILNGVSVFSGTTNATVSHGFSSTPSVTVACGGSSSSSSTARAASYGLGSLGSTTVKVLSSATGFPMTGWAFFNS